jgi:hypothetical protein
MNWESFKKQLRREVSEYLADLRNIRDALRHVEGWITLALVLAVIFMMAVWFIVGLGFDRLAFVAGALGVSRSRVCMPLSDINAMIIIMDAMAMGLLAVMALGEMMRLLDRVRKGLPSEPRKVAVPSFFMLLVGIGGIIFMRAIC